MFRRIAASLALGLVLLMIAGCHHAKVVNPIANVNSKQPDKVLFDRAMDAMNKGKYDVARMSLQVLINTYPDSEYVARAKLSVADSWYAEGGATGLQQAEIEYKDFITFFPNMPEAAEAQLKVANIHYRQMEKADRDYTHAKRAEDEYRTLIQQFPDSKLVPQAKEKLLQVQEVLGEREYRIGRFYFLRESWAAAIARLKTLADTYPLYSKADDALMMLGDAYERQIDSIRNNNQVKDETIRGRMIDVEKAHAKEAYDRIITRYPEGGLADKARARLEALHLPVPKATPEAIAQNKAEEESRGHLSRYGKLMLNFHRGPDIATASKVGEPTITDPEQTSAPAVVAQSAKEMLNAVVGSDSNKASVEVVGKGAPPANAAPPRSDNPVGGMPPTTTTNEPTAPAVAAPSPKPQIPDNSGIQDLAAQPGATVQPSNAAPANPPAAEPPATPPANTAPATTAPSSPPPGQVNDAKSPTGDTAKADAKTDDKDSQDSSSIKKKKKKKNSKDKGQDQK